VTGERYLDWFMGLSSVSLGHAEPRVGEAIRQRYQRGTNFQLPTSAEAVAAEAFLDRVARADMVKFAKDGSAVNDAAVRLARYATGRRLVARCADSPFLSYQDWFIGNTRMRGGVLAETAEAARPTFRYNRLDDVEALFAQHRGEIAAVILEPYRFAEPEPGFLPGLRRLCDRDGAVLVFDEVVAGLKYTLGGAQHVFDVRPDLSTWGKGIANGLPLSALTGRRELMELGDSTRNAGGDGLLLLSSTHGGEALALAAMRATVDIFQTDQVNAHLDGLGARLRAGITERVAAHGLTGRLAVAGRSCFLTIIATDDAGRDSRRHRTQLYRLLIERGVLFRGIFCGSASHTTPVLDRTLAVLDTALAEYARLLGEPDDPRWHDEIGQPL
jgi:glutamate-1-semialdehyde 2,1-aminomutase